MIFFIWFMMNFITVKDKTALISQFWSVMLLVMRSVMISVIHAVVDGVSQRYQVSKFTLCVKIPGQLDIQILQTVGGCVNTGEIRNNFQHQLWSAPSPKLPLLCIIASRQKDKYKLFQVFLWKFSVFVGQKYLPALRTGKLSF